jgi:hypothetical protein
LYILDKTHHGLVVVLKNLLVPVQKVPDLGVGALLGIYSEFLDEADVPYDPFSQLHYFLF